MSGNGRCRAHARAGGEERQGRTTMRTRAPQDTHASTRAHARAHLAARPPDIGQRAGAEQRSHRHPSRRRACAHVCSFCSCFARAASPAARARARARAHTHTHTSQLPRGQHNAVVVSHGAEGARGSRAQSVAHGRRRHRVRHRQRGLQPVRLRTPRRAAASRARADARRRCTRAHRGRLVDRLRWHEHAHARIGHQRRERRQQRRRRRERRGRPRRRGGGGGCEPRVQGHVLLRARARVGHRAPSKHRASAAWARTSRTAPSSRAPARGTRTSVSTGAYSGAARSGTSEYPITRASGASRTRSGAKSWARESQGGPRAGARA